MSTSTLTKQKKSKSKKSTKAPEEDSSAGKNEGVDLNWAYKPPPGATPIITNEDNEEFDWNSVKEDDDIEVWVLRVPENIKSNHLEGLDLDFSNASLVSTASKRKTGRIGTFKRKQNSYDIWSLGDEDNEAGGEKNPDLDQKVHLIGGEELYSLSCLLPRKSKQGKLYQSTKPITRHFVVSARPPEPSASTDDASSSESINRKNPPRHKYSPERFNHRFLPYGALVNLNDAAGPTSIEEPPNESPMEVDAIVSEEEETEPKKSKRKTEKVEKLKPKIKADADEGLTIEKEKKGKKRKKDQGDAGASEKKLKKARTTS